MFGLNSLWQLSREKDTQWEGERKEKECPWWGREEESAVFKCAGLVPSLAVLVRRFSSLHVLPLPPGQIGMYILSDRVNCLCLCVELYLCCVHIFFVVVVSVVPRDIFRYFVLVRGHLVTAHRPRRTNASTIARYSFFAALRCLDSA